MAVNNLTTEQKIIKENFRDTSFHLAKALHFANVSKQYFELLKLEAKGETKMLFQNCIQRMDWVYHNIYDRLSQNSRDILKKEMEDSLCFDEIINRLVLLEPEQRTRIENLITALSKGETIEFVTHNTY